jgi:hypothetical protein
VSSTDRRRPRGSRGLLLGAVAAAAVVAAACTPEPFIAEGTSFGASDSFELETGTHAISWTARDGQAPADGCLFGLLLDPEDLGAAEGIEPPPGFEIPKLAYQVLDDGGSLSGLKALELPAGQYRVLIEGSCWWSVRVDRH